MKVKMHAFVKLVIDKLIFISYSCINQLIY